MIQQIPDEEFNAFGPTICKGHQSLGQCRLLENRSYLLGLSKRTMTWTSTNFFRRLADCASCKPTGHLEGFNDSGCRCSKFETCKWKSVTKVENEPAGIAAWLMISFKMDGTSISEKQSGKWLWKNALRPNNMVMDWPKTLICLQEFLLSTSFICHIKHGFPVGLSIAMLDLKMIDALVYP